VVGRTCPMKSGGGSKPFALGNTIRYAIVIASIPLVSCLGDDKQGRVDPPRDCSCDDRVLLSIDLMLEERFASRNTELRIRVCPNGECLPDIVIGGSDASVCSGRWCVYNNFENCSTNDQICLEAAIKGIGTGDLGQIQGSCGRSCVGRGLI
jgi:hypothetical protein